MCSWPQEAVLSHQGRRHQGGPLLLPPKGARLALLLPPRVPELSPHEQGEVVTVRWMTGYLFDGWNSLRFAATEMGKAIDRAMDVWPE